VLEQHESRKAIVEHSLTLCRGQAAVHKKEEDTSEDRRARATAEVHGKRSDIAASKSRSETLRKDALSRREDLDLLESELAVDAEIQSTSISVVANKNIKLLSSIEEAASLEIREQAKISDLKQQIVTISTKAERVREDIKFILNERDKFQNEKAVINQRLDQKISECRNHEAMLAAKQEDLQNTHERKLSIDRNLSSLRDREYAVLETMKELQIEETRIHSEFVRVGKHFQSLSATLSSIRKRSSDLQAQVSDTELEIVRLSSLNCTLESNISSQELTLQEAETKTSRLSRESVEVDKRVQEQTDIMNKFKLRLDQSDFEKQSLENDSKELSETISRKRASNETQHSELEKLETDLATLNRDLCSFTAEANQIKRINRGNCPTPALIESESPLIERLEINTYLRFAQAQLQPIPLIVEKIAQLLTVLSTARDKSDESLSKLRTYNSDIAATRRISIMDQEKQLSLSSFKRDALLRAVENQLDDINDMAELFLDGCSVSQIDLSMLRAELRRLAMIENIHRVSLSRNNISDSCAYEICELIVDLPYISKLDLSRNFISHHGCQIITTRLSSLGGVTEVIVENDDRMLELPGFSKSDGFGAVIIARSGKMTRLTVDLRDQSDPASMVDTCDRKRGPVPRIARPTECEPTQIQQHTSLRNPSESKGVLPEKGTQPLILQYPSPKKTIRQASQNTARLSQISDESFVRQLNLSKRNIATKASRLGIKSTSPYS
jgi:hypothetical protein